MLYASKIGHIDILFIDIAIATLTSLSVCIGHSYWRACFHACLFVGKGAVRTGPYAKLAAFLLNNYRL